MEPSFEKTRLLLWSKEGGKMYNRIIYIIGIELRESAVTARRRGKEKGENIYLICVKNLKMTNKYSTHV